MEPREFFLSPLEPDEIHRFLLGYGLRDTKRAERTLDRLVELTGRPTRLAKLADELFPALAQTADPDQSLIQLEAFLEVSASRSSLLSWFIDNTGVLTALLRLVGDSPFLSQVLSRNPEYAYWLFERQRLERVETLDYFLKSARESLRFERVETSLESLRRFRRRETLRIAAQDILDGTSFDNQVRQISDLATALIQTCLQLVSQSSPDGFAVLAMGKLGGRELNFSSDVDLIYVYADDAPFTEMLRLARNLTSALSDVTAEGRLYRVDLRLRPSGRTGEIAYPLAAYRHYYENWADTFDRLALIKCRFIAGDRKLGQAFQSLAEGFVYKKYLDFAALEEIRWLKHKSDRKIRRRGESERDVKLGTGGIREVEFFVQSFQLLYGARYPDIRSANTSESLDRLLDAGFLSHDDFVTLRDGYVFLRSIEHRLQLVHDRQTQTLPSQSEEMEMLARRLEWTSASAVEDFRRELEKCRADVHRLYQSLFQSRELGGLRDLVLNPSLDEADRMDLLSPFDFPDGRSVLRSIDTMIAAPSFPQSPTRVRNLLANLLPRLLEMASLSEEGAAFIGRLDRFMDSLGSRSSLLQVLVEDSGLANRLFRVLLCGDSLSQTLIRQPELFDTISVPHPPELEDQGLSQLVDAQPDSMPLGERLRLLKHRKEFKIGALDLFEWVGPLEARRGLSILAEYLLGRALSEVASQQTGEGLGDDWELLAMGKLGARELGYHSDLDLVLIYNDERHAWWSCLVEALGQWCGEYTESGRLYELDFRLRPEGRRSSPATPWSTLLEYSAGRAQAWERLAWVRGRRIFGGRANLFSQLELKPFNAEEADQIRYLRGRQEKEIGRESQKYYDFKVGLGGLMDIQFLVQFLQVQSGVRETSTVSAIETLRGQGVMDPSQADILLEGYRFLNRLETVHRLLSSAKGSRLHRDPKQLRRPAYLMGYDHPADLLRDYEQRTTEIRGLYDQLCRV